MFVEGSFCSRESYVRHVIYSSSSLEAAKRKSKVLGDVFTAEKCLLGFSRFQPCLPGSMFLRGGHYK